MKTGWFNPVKIQWSGPELSHSPLLVGILPRTTRRPHFLLWKKIWIEVAVMDSSYFNPRFCCSPSILHMRSHQLGQEEGCLHINREDLGDLRRKKTLFNFSECFVITFGAWFQLPTLSQTSSVDSNMFPKKGLTAALDTRMSIPPNFSRVCYT